MTTLQAEADALPFANSEQAPAETSNLESARQAEDSTKTFSAL